MLGLFCGLSNSRLSISRVGLSLWVYIHARACRYVRILVCPCISVYLYTSVSVSLSVRVSVARAFRSLVKLPASSLKARHASGRRTQSSFPPPFLFFMSFLLSLGVT